MMSATFDSFFLRTAFEKWRMATAYPKSRYLAVDNLLYTNKVKVSQYFKHWLIHVRKEKIVLQRFMSSGRMRLKATYLKHWVQYADFRRSKRSLSSKLILRYKFSLASKCLKAWANHLVLLAKRRDMIRNFISRWLEMCLRKHFSCWVEKVARKKFILRQVSLSGEAKIKRIQLRAFTHWKQVLDGHKRRTMRIEGYIAQNGKAKDKKLMRRHFYDWRSVKPMREKLVRLAQDRQAFNLITRSFRHWRKIAREKENLSRMMRDQHDAKVRVQTFESWQAIAKQKAAFRRYRQKQKWFLRWKFEVTLRESYYEESSVLEEASLGLDEDIGGDLYPDVLRSSYTKAVEDVGLLEVKIAGLSQRRAKAGRGGRKTPVVSPAPLFASADDSVLDDTDAILRELDTQSAKIRQRLAELKTP